MKCAASLSAGALAVVLLLTVTGTTTAAWRADAPVPAASVAAGTLGVALDAAGDPADPVVLAPGLALTATYDLDAELHGDNLDAVLRLSVPAWQDSSLLDVLEITAVVERGGTAVATGTLDTVGAFRFDGAPDVPVELPRDAVGELTVTLTVAMDPWAGNAYQGLRLEDGDLVADLWQVRAGGSVDDRDRLWSDGAAAPAPDVVSASGVEVESAPRSRTDEADAAGPGDATGPDAADEASGTGQADPAGTPDDAAAAPGPGAVPGTEPSTEPEPEPEPTETSPTEPDPGPTETSPAEPAPADPEPEWADDLLDLLDEVGLDEADVDPDDLPAEVEEWAEAHEVALDDVRAWFEGRAS